MMPNQPKSSLLAVVCAARIVSVLQAYQTEAATSRGRNVPNAFRRRLSWESLPLAPAFDTNLHEAGILRDIDPFVKNNGMNLEDQIIKKYFYFLQYNQRTSRGVTF